MDHSVDLDLCIRSIIERATYKNLEFIVVENNSTEQETFAYYEKIQKEFPQVKVVRWEREFNYSAINNFGAAFAKGEYLMLLNNDTEIIAPRLFEEMLGFCQRKEVGIVERSLLYEDVIHSARWCRDRFWRRGRTYLHRPSRGGEQLLPPGNVCPGLQRRDGGLPDGEKVCV